jgi:hypothetical protein
VPVETTKIEYVNKVESKIDSVFIRDSIDRYINGDTVFLNKYHTIYKYVDRVKVDTVIKIDSIQTPIYVETIKYENKIKSYQSFLMYSGVLFILLIAYIIYKFLKKNIDKIKSIF